MMVVGTLAHAWVATCAGSSVARSCGSFNAALARSPLPAYITLLHLYTLVNPLTHVAVTFNGQSACHWHATELLAELAGQLRPIIRLSAKTDRQRTACSSFISVINQTKLRASVSSSRRRPLLFVSGPHGEYNTCLFGHKGEDGSCPDGRLTGHI